MGDKLLYKYTMHSVEQKAIQKQKQKGTEFVRGISDIILPLFIEQ